MEGLLGGLLGSVLGGLFGGLEWCLLGGPNRPWWKGTIWVIGHGPPAQLASGGGCLPQPRWAVCATGAGAHQGQTSCEGEKDIWWTAGTVRGGTGHLGLTHTETQQGRLWTACGQRRVDSKNSQTTPATTSTSSIRQLLGAADAQTAHHATFSTGPTHQLLGSANAEIYTARSRPPVPRRYGGRGYGGGTRGRYRGVQGGGTGGG